MKTIEKRFFYGWINLVVLSIAYISIVGMITYNFGVTVSAMAADLKMSMTLATACYSGSMLIQALISPLLARYVAEHGVRRTMMIGCVLVFISGLTLGWSQSWVFYFLSWIPFVAFGQRFGAVFPAQICIADWFLQKRGFATALYYTVGGLSGFMITPLMTRITVKYSWRSTWYLMSAFCIITFIMVFFLLKDKPEDVGQHIDGISDTSLNSDKVPRQSSFKTIERWMLADAKRSMAFYQICLLQISVVFMSYCISSQALNSLVASGIHLTVASSAIGIYSFTSIAGRLLVGFFSDRVEPRRIMILGSIAVFAGVIFLNFSYSSVTAYSFAVITGIGFGILLVGPPTMLADYFGTADYVRINSHYSFISGIISASSTVTAGAIYDLTGGYTAVWCVVLALILINGISLLFLKMPKKKSS